MSFQARVYNVMVASPSDVKDGLPIVTEAISRWNAHHGQNRQVLLLPLAWSTHSSPELGNRPQAILNRQLVEKSDLLVAIFWTRLGTPTGEAESGTVEEIREHVKKKKPVLIYFCQQEVDLDTVDLNQYETLKAFRSELEKQGLVDSYKNGTELLAKLEKHFAQKILDDPYFQSSLSMDLPSVTLPFIGSNTPPSLSPEAKELLDAVVKDGGEIVVHNVIFGKLISTGRRTFPTQEPRDRAKYEALIEDLENRGFIKAMGSKRELFRVTDAGYKLIDFAEQNASRTDQVSKSSHVPKTEEPTGGATVSGKPNVVKAWQSLVELAKSDQRAAIQKSWELLAEDIFRAANVAGVDADPNSQEIASSLKRLEGSVQFSSSLIGSIKEHQDIARKVFYQSNYAYDPSTDEAQKFVLGSQAIINDLRREAK